MNRSRPLWLLVLLVLVSACRYRDPSLIELEHEARWLEDQVYMLEDELAMRCDELARYREQATRPCDEEPTPAARLPRLSPTPAGSSRRSQQVDRPTRRDEADEFSEPEVVIPDGDDDIGDDYETVSPSGQETPPSSEPEERYEIPRLPTREDTAVPNEPKPAGQSSAGGPSGYESVEAAVPTSTQPVAAPPAAPPTGAPGYEVLPEAAITKDDADDDASLFDEGANGLMLLPPEEIPAPAGAAPADGGTRPKSNDEGRTAPPIPGPTNVQLASWLEEAGIAASPDKSHDHEAGGAGPGSDFAVDEHILQLSVQAWHDRPRRDDAVEQSPAGPLNVWIQPRTADGYAVPLGGPVTIAVLDRQAQGDAARVARWDFSAAQARRAIRHESPGTGIRFRLDWPTEPPTSSELFVFVRLETRDARRLEASCRLGTAPPAESPTAEKGQWRAARGKRLLARSRPPANASPAEPRVVASGIELKPIPKKTTASSKREVPQPYRDGIDEREARDTDEGTVPGEDGLAGDDRLESQDNESQDSESPSGAEDPMPVLIEDEEPIEWSPDRP